MNFNRGHSLQIYFSYLAYLLSGFFIFNPLLSSGNIILSLFISFAASLIIFEVLLFCFSKTSLFSSGKSPVAKATGIICASLSSVTTLILITEIIRSVAFITNRYISLFYYIAISAAILTVSFNLCFGKAKGIYRFCTIASIIFTILCLISVLSFITAKGLIPYENLTKNASSAIKSGVLSGLFVTSDSAIYFFIFSRYIRKQSGFLSYGILRLSFMTAFFLMAVFSVCLMLIFSCPLASDIRDPAYSLIKLIPGIDFTEFLSCARIVAFMIKSSVYIYTGAKLLTLSFTPKKNSENIFISIIYLSVPLLYLTSLMTEKRHSYGAYQGYIYVFVSVLSALILFLHMTGQKKKKQ